MVPYLNKTINTNNIHSTDTYEQNHIIKKDSKKELTVPYLLLGFQQLIAIARGPSRAGYHLLYYYVHYYVYYYDSLSLLLLLLIIMLLLFLLCSLLVLLLLLLL